MEYKENWDKSKERFNALWEREIIDRCCISVTAPKTGSCHTAEKLPQNAEDKIKYWSDGDWILRRYLKTFENTYYGGEAFPQIWLNLGAAGHAGYFKHVRYQFENTVWFFPIIHDWDNTQLEFDERSFLYRKTVDLARCLVNESKGRFFVSMPDTSGNADVLAHLRGSDLLLMDMATDGNIVKKALEEIQKVWLKTNETIFDIVKDNNDGGCTIGWLDTWAPGRHAQLQCDLSVMISPAMFEEFILPELKNQVMWMDHSTYHFDGIEQVRHLDMLLSIERLSMIQWTSVAGQPSPIEFIPELKKIQKAGKALLLSLTSEEIEPVMEELSSKGLYIRTTAPSEEEARDIIRKVEKLTHE